MDLEQFLIFAGLALLFWKSDYQITAQAPHEESNQLRLVDGPSRCAGRVEIYHDGRWGTICDDSWNKTDADVVCKQLGCGYGVKATTGGYYRKGTGEIWLDDVQCAGNETHIQDCPANQYGKHNCDHEEDAGAICSGHREYRLAHGPQSCCGYLEAKHGDTWGSVCEIDAELRTANVVCRELRCGDAVPSLLNYTRRPGPIWREKIHCVGNESSVYGCLRRDVEGNCTKQNPPAIECKAPVRLYGGNTECEGLLEVRYGGEWRAVQYYRSYSESVANIVCRELGCNTANAQHLVTTGDIFVDDYRRSLDLRCTGGESSLSQCRYLHNSLYPSASLMGVKCSGERLSNDLDQLGIQ
ncbi:scavenger receptor cysteine-rich type 1 protein M160-like [Eleutherodactylus coqui]|uniref:scavenger receptor cysteine-rich type 1 protein M160-like n=1 Tax=Eleutherodactylus coqui TaxID=57060 RepID=UPI003462D1F5